MTQENRPFETGPYLTAALLCEKVLNEADGVKSLIRVIDRITVNAVGPPPPGTPPPIFPLTLFIAFKSGSARGPMNVTVRIDRPSTDPNPEPLQKTVNFEGEGDRGVNLIIPIAFNASVPGLWWFTVQLAEPDGDPVTVSNVPLRVIFLQQPMPRPATPPGAGPQQ